jgi:hypothetical protein
MREHLHHEYVDPETDRLHHATYTPATLITAKVMGNGAANIATWRYQNTGGAGTFGVVRTATFNSATAARTITVEQGSTAADTAAQKILDAYVLTVNVPYILNGWITVQNNDYFEGFANNTDIIAAAYGYTFA